MSTLSGGQRTASNGLRYAQYSSVVLLFFFIFHIIQKLSFLPLQSPNTPTANADCSRTGETLGNIHFIIYIFLLIKYFVSFGSNFDATNHNCITCLLYDTTQSYKTYHVYISVYITEKILIERIIVKTTERKARCFLNSPTK